MFKKTITSDFFTTISFKQCYNSLLSLTLRLPFLRYGNSNILFEKKFLEFLGLNNSKVISFYNGRSAIYNCLKALNLNKGSEVIINGYNCITVSNAILQSGLKIKYSDIETDTFSFDLENLKNNINKNTKVIIIQHTFGFKAKYYDEIISLARLNKIIVVEDCAHSLGTDTGYKGDFAIYSTGRDKVISTVTGGFLIINNSDYFNRVDGIKASLNIPSRLLVIKNHLYNLIGYKSFILYDFFKIGRIIMFFSLKYGLLTKILTNSEKECNFNKFNYSLPNSLAFLGILELKNIKKHQKNREELGLEYIKNISNNKVILQFGDNYNLNYFRLPILLSNSIEREVFFNYMKSNNVLLGKSWSGINIAPIGSNLKKAGYNLGDCKNAENLSFRVLTLPNHILLNKDDILKVCYLINNYKK